MGWRMDDVTCTECDGKHVVSSTCSSCSCVRTVVCPVCYGRGMLSSFVMREAEKRNAAYMSSQIYGQWDVARSSLRTFVRQVVKEMEDA